MKEYRLGDIIDIKHGYAFDGDHIVQEDNGIVLVTPGNFRIGGGFQEEKCKFFTGEIPDDYVLSAGDFIVTMTDLSKEIDTLGYSAIVPDTNRTYLHNQRIGLVSFKNNECHPGYIYFLMRTHQYQRSIANTSTGATVHHTSPSKICDYQFYAPSYEKQRRIAEYLFVYEKLTENNQKQIKLLEEAAQRLYKEWFVDLRFPGHETTPIVDGVPEGWNRGILGDIVTETGEKVSKEKRDIFDYYLPIDCLPKKSLGYVTTNEIKLAESSLVSFAPGDILFGAMRPYFHKVVVARDSGLTRTTCFVLNTPKKVFWAYAVMLMFSPDTVDYASQISVGTTMPYTRWKDFKNMPILIPEESCACKFGEIVCPIIEKINGSAEQVMLLQRARDRLLPKLMSGEIEV